MWSKITSAIYHNYISSLLKNNTSTFIRTFLANLTAKVCIFDKFGGLQIHSWCILGTFNAVGEFGCIINHRPLAVPWVYHILRASTLSTSTFYPAVLSLFFYGCNIHSLMSLGFTCERLTDQWVQTAVGTMKQHLVN